MNILIDIAHIPHINFFKNALAILKEKGVNVKVICLDRGRNVIIAREEFKGIDVIPIGKHRGNLFSIIFEANLVRFLLTIKYLLFNKVDAGLSVGSFLLGFGLKIFRKPNSIFYDDLENKKAIFLIELAATDHFHPNFLESRKATTFNALKEWAYLSPKYFIPKKECLKEYDVKEKDYIFVREVNSNTTNYIGQSADIISTIANNFPPNIKVILSLENKEKINFYPKSWMLLKEPVKDIHSLMYYSKVLLSSGDSVSREGAMLGVPSIYCGIRTMAANKVMEDKGLLFQIEISKVPNFINEVFKGEFIDIDQVEFRKQLATEWDDVTELIVSNALKLIKLTNNKNKI